MQFSKHSLNVFESIKYGVNCRKAAKWYGMEFSRYGMAICPLHNDRHLSLYLSDDHCHCFACYACGDVIDFYANLFSLPLYEAAQRLASDFCINADRPSTQAVLEKRMQK